MNYREYFKNKKVTIVGLGEKGKALADAQFLARMGASVVVTDPGQEALYAELLKKIKAEEKEVVKDEEVPVQEETTNETQADISPEHRVVVDTIVKKKRKDWRENISFHFGSLRPEDFENKDLIIRDLSIPLDTPALLKAMENKIPVEVSECLFVKLAPPITLIGVTGTCGKSTTAYLISEFLTEGFKDENEKFYYIDQYNGVAALPLLSKINREDIVLIELSTLLLEEFDKAHISPHIAVVTNLIPDHLDRYNSEHAYFNQKIGIIRYQTYNNFFIANDETVDLIKKEVDLPFKAKIMRTSVNIIPSSWQLENRFYHMRENIALAMRVAEVLRVSMDVIQPIVETFKGLKGRLELVKKVRGVSYYNDSASQHPHATLTALKCIGENKNIILIWGGKNREVKADEFLKMMPQYVSTLILLPGSGTLKFHKNLIGRDDIKHVYAHSIYDAVQIARDNSSKGDIVLFSPGFEAGGVEKNETQRGEHFIWALRSL